MARNRNQLIQLRISGLGRACPMCRPASCPGSGRVKPSTPVKYAEGILQLLMGLGAHLCPPPLHFQLKEGGAEGRKAAGGGERRSSRERDSAVRPPRITAVLRQS